MPLITDFCFAAVVSVEATYSYYEKVTEELERIVHEVQVKEEAEPLSDGEKLFLLTFTGPLLKCERAECMCFHLTESVPMKQNQPIQRTPGNKQHFSARCSL